MKKAIILFVFIIAGCSSSTSATPTARPAQPSAPPDATFTATDEPVIVELPDPVNLALGAAVRVSNALPDFPAVMAVDGISAAGADNWWSAGDRPPQWIEIDLGAPASIQAIRLLTSQSPPGPTSHQVWGRSANGTYQLLHEFNDTTGDNQWLTYSPAEPWVDIQFVKIETVASPSWVSWREIEIIGIPGQAEVAETTPVTEGIAEIIFFNGEIVTMNENMDIAEAIAVKGEMIIAVGDEDEVMEFAGPDTKLIDLDGRTAIPGIVDTHTHILKDMGVSIEDAQQIALENGITTLVEMTTLPGFLADLEAVDARGGLRVRVTAYLAHSNPCGDLEGDWYLEHAPTHEFGEMLRIGGVKVFADGGTCGLPAVSFEYPGGQGQGDLWFTQDEMNQIVASIHAAGYQVAIHAQGDRAIEQVLNAIELALDGESNTLRHRIEHNPFIRPDLLPRYSEVGVLANIVGPYPTCAEINDGYYSNFFGMENLSWLENWRAFVDANPDLHIAWHGDDPWITPVSPLLEMYSLVTRAEVAEDGTVCEPPDWLASHALTAEEVLRMMTIEGAYFLFREDEVGSLEVGKLADLLILSANPLTIDPDGIRDIEFWLTMVGGVTEYCAPGREAFCPE